MSRRPARGTGRSLPRPAGVKPFRDCFVQGQEPWDEGTFELGEVLDAPSDRIVAHQRARMRGTASRADVELELLACDLVPQWQGGAFASGSPTEPRPSKPLGLRSRRCRRRTSAANAACLMPSTGATSMPSWRSATQTGGSDFFISWNCRAAAPTAATTASEARWKSLFRYSSDFRTEIEEVRDLGDVTVTRIRFHGRGGESDAPWEQTQWQVAHWRRGKMIRGGTFLSEAEALEAAGLEE